MALLEMRYCNDMLFWFPYRGMESHILAQQQNENAATPKDIQGTDGKCRSTL